VPKIIINDTLNSLFKTAISIGNGQPSELPLCQLYRYTLFLIVKWRLILQLRHTMFYRRLAGALTNFAKTTRNLLSDYVHKQTGKHENCI